MFRLPAALVLLILVCFGVAVMADDEPARSNLPLERIVLFNSGVGFFEHRAEIEGDARVDLKFNVENINDLLKSLVLEDAGGGHVAPVTYGSQDPITKTLSTFAIDLTDNPTLARLLDQIRGEAIEIDAPNAMTGKIVGVETRKRKVGDDVIEIEILNLLTDDGLRSVPLESVGRIKLVNEKLDAEFRQALAVLALGHATDKKTVSLDFLGDGKRQVRVGYVQEAPIWKTSYRLVLTDDAPPFLQGWAIVENTTEEDWRDVSLTLVSGRPISFVMNLYQPLYVPRPVVEPELFASLRPQTYGQDLAKRDAEFAERAVEGRMAGKAGLQQRGRRKLAEAGAGPAAPAAAEGDARGVGITGFSGQGIGGLGPVLDRGVQSLAQGGDVGELFQYVIDTPVTLPRRQSAMLPIVNGAVEGEKVAIYNVETQPKHPLNGLRLKNTTDLHLMQGPITVFDDGAYAGDAQIEDLSPGGERLISYSLDLQTEVATESRGAPQQLVRCKLTKGVLITTHKHQRSHDYTIKNSGKKAKQVLVEYPHDSDWTLTAPKKADETTRDRYRFTVKAEPGEPAKLHVEEERNISQQLELSNLDDNMIRFYINAEVVSDAVKKALTEVVARKQRIAELAAKKQDLERQVATIDQEQQRIRQNMPQLDRNSDLYRRYVKKFSEQEDQMEKLRGGIQEVAADQEKRQQALDEYLAGLDLGDK